MTPEGAVSGKPTVSLDGKTGKPPVTYGRLAGMSMINPQLAVAGTVNKDGGTPVSQRRPRRHDHAGDVRRRQRQGLTSGSSRTPIWAFASTRSWPRAGRR